MPTDSGFCANFTVTIFYFNFFLSFCGRSYSNNCYLHCYLVTISSTVIISFGQHHLYFLTLMLLFVHELCVCINLKKKQQQRICFTYALVLTQFFYQKIITYINLEFSISSLSKNINFNCVALKSSHLLLVRYNFLYLLIRNSFQNSSEQFHIKNVKLYFIW